MARNWTFGQKIGAGFAVTVALTLVIGAVAIYALRTVVTAQDVISVNAYNITDAERLAVASTQRVAAVRGYFLTKQDSHLEELRGHRELFLSILARLRQQVHDPEGRRLIEDIERKEVDYRTTSEKVIALRQGEAAMDVIVRKFDEEVAPRRIVMNQALDAFIAYGERILEQEKRAATATTTSAIALVVVIAIIVVILATAIALLLTRTLGRQVGTAVGQVQSSSAELQAAANQQATGAKEQATAMNEITTTISELLATSRQIGESAQRVAQVAEQTAGAARSGDGTVDKGHEAVAGIRRQVDLIVNHMLDLGKKSQQIGAVLDIVAELAEQTNILAINATIEAAGAGEAGKRFAVVAEEIRKLADRVGGSTKEIRGLIDDVRSAVNTTVMTTETGSKAVEAGTKQFAEVASAFKHIAGLVTTTREAAKEIELSTKQQTTAVEQVNIAITNVAQASKETEASTGQTLQTASELTGLSRDLLRLVRPQATPRVHQDPDGWAGRSG
ncbi:MAG: HAMP domain-containing methyl-accepting chemotaxis protein [Gammaproteobacteria bacterium]